MSEDVPMADTLGQRIERARLDKGWSRARLAEEASALPGAPDVTADQIRTAESGRRSLRLNELGRPEPLPYILKALGLSVLLGAASGMREGR